MCSDESIRVLASALCLAHEEGIDMGYHAASNPNEPYQRNNDIVQQSVSSNWVDWVASAEYLLKNSIR